MIPTSYLRNFLLAAGSSLIAVSSTNAATETVYWDGNSTTANADGGTGTWNALNFNWDSLLTGGLDIIWDADASGDDTAIFGGTAGTVTASGSIALKNLTFTHTTGTYTISGGTLAFSSAGTILASNPPNTSTVNAIIQSNITGAPALNLTPMDGDDQFTLNPAASGSMSIGTVSGSGALGSERLNLQGGAGSSGTIGDANGVKVLVSSGAWTLNGDGSFGDGHAVSAGTLTLNANLNATHRSVALSGTGVLNYNIAGAVSATLATNASTDNGFRIIGGTLDNTSGAAINTNNSTTHIDLGGTLTFAGSLGANSNLHLGSGPVWLKDGNRQITVTNAATTLIIGGVIQNDDTLGRSLTKAGAGTLELRGNSTYSGATTISAGTLTATDIVASTTVLASSVTADATLDVITLTGNTLVDGNKVVFGGTTVPTGLTAGTVYFVRDTSGNTFKVAATSGGAAINFSGAGTAVTVTRPGALGSTNSAIVLGNADTTTNNSSPTLLMSGAFTNERAITIANQATAGVYTIGGSNTSGTATYTGAITLNRALTLQAATGGTVDFQSAFTTNGNAITIGSSGKTGTVRLRNTLSTAGGVSVNFGTFLLNSSDLLSDTTPVTVAGGILDLGALTDTVASFNMSSGSLNGSGTLTAASYNVTGGTLAAKLGGSGGLTKTGGGTTIVSGDNTYTGDTDLINGILQLDGSTHASSTVKISTAGTLSGTGTVNGNATLTGNGTINKASGTIAGTLGITGGNWNGNGAVTGLITSSSGIFTIGNGANLTANGNLDITGGTLAAGDSSSTITGSLNYTSASSSTFAGVIAGAGKTLTLNNNSAVLTLFGDNTYTGATSVNAGKLLIHGSTVTDSAFTVNNGATLGGRGTIGGTVTLMSGAILSPGASIESLATGSNTWNGGSTVQVEFSTDGSTGAAETEWDLINITGTLDLSGASSSSPITLDLVSMLNDTNAGPLAVWDENANATWAGFVTTTGGITGFAADKFVFTTLNFQNTLNGTFNVSQDGNNLNLNYVTNNVIPEPKAALLGGIGLLLLLRRRR